MRKELHDLKRRYSILRKAEGWSLAVEDGRLPSYFHATEAYEDGDGLLIEVLGEIGTEKLSGRFIRERCGDRYYISYWFRDGDTARYQFRGRVALDDKIDAEALLSVYTRTSQSLTKVDMSVSREMADYYKQMGLDKEYRAQEKRILERYAELRKGHSEGQYKFSANSDGSQQELSFEFIAHSNEVKASFFSWHEDFSKMTPSEMQQRWDSSINSMDEIRFDDIEISDVETGEKVMAWK